MSANATGYGTVLVNVVPEKQNEIWGFTADVMPCSIMTVVPSLTAGGHKMKRLER
jgi:hypothetical protein